MSTTNLTWLFRVDRSLVAAAVVASTEAEVGVVVTTLSLVMGEEVSAGVEGAEVTGVSRTGTRRLEITTSPWRILSTTITIRTRTISSNITSLVLVGSIGRRASEVVATTFAITMRPVSTITVATAVADPHSAKVAVLMAAATNLLEHQRMITQEVLTPAVGGTMTVPRITTLRVDDGRPQGSHPVLRYTAMS